MFSNESAPTSFNKSGSIFQALHQPSKIIFSIEELWLSFPNIKRTIANSHHLLESVYLNTFTPTLRPFNIYLFHDKLQLKQQKCWNLNYSLVLENRLEPYKALRSLRQPI